jgi:uncharacterized RDD family membrane protein YckC
MFCSQCGAEADEGDRYCQQCGRLLSGTSAAQPREVASGGEPGLSWAGRGPASAGAPAVPAAGERPRVSGSEAMLAGFWRRAGSLTIDATAWWGLSTVVWMIAMGVYFATNGFPERAEPETEFIPEADLGLITLIVHAIVWSIVFGATWWFNSIGWTIGKRAVGLRIVRKDGQPPGLGPGLARTMGAWLSWLSLGLGFLWAAWDERGQTWHDKMAGTYVVQADSLRAHHERGTRTGSLH